MNKRRRVNYFYCERHDDVYAVIHDETREPKAFAIQYAHQLSYLCCGATCVRAGWDWIYFGYRIYDDQLLLNEDHVDPTILQKQNGFAYELSYLDSIDLNAILTCEEVAEATSVCD